MKTKAELRAWIDGARDRFGDPSVPTGLLFAKYEAATRDSDLVTFTIHRNAIYLFTDERTRLTRIAVSEGAPRFDGHGIVSLGVERVGPDLWALNPSVNIPGVFHAFLVLYNVPEKVSWA